MSPRWIIISIFLCLFCAIGALSFNVGLYFYYFRLDNGVLVGKGENYVAEETNTVKPFQLSSYKKGYKTPNFIKGGLIYQIFPDRFCRKEKVNNRGR